MKTTLFAALLCALALSACGKKEEAVVLPPPATQPSLVAPNGDTAPAPGAPASEAAVPTPAPAQDSQPK